MMAKFSLLSSNFLPFLSLVFLRQRIYTHTSLCIQFGVLSYTIFAGESPACTLSGSYFIYTYTRLLLTSKKPAALIPLPPFNPPILLHPHHTHRPNHPTSASTPPHRFPDPPKPSRACSASVPSPGAEAGGEPCPVRARGA
jgi:hypothetical protein